MDYNFVEVAWPACFNYLSLLVSMGSQGKLLCTLNIKKEVSVKIYQTSRLQICVNFFPAASHWQKDRVAPKTVQLACLCINYYECQIYSDSLRLHSWWAMSITLNHTWQLGLEPWWLYHLAWGHTGHKCMAHYNSRQWEWLVGSNFKAIKPITLESKYLELNCCK